MAYAEFLEQFATAQGVASVDELLSKHADRYAFQIGSRDRAKRAIQLLQDNFNLDFKGKKVLDVGCAYGSLSIEIAKLGATVVGIDISDKWLKLGEVNARGEGEVKLINCDASTFAATKQLGEDGPFDIIIVNDVFEHIYDTAGLVANLSKLMAPSGLVYFKVPNGLATRHVLQEGHKRTFGISLLAPDYWQAFVSAPFHIYYRRWDHFRGIFALNGFNRIDLLNQNTDSDHEKTKRFILNDMNRIRRHLVPENFKDRTQLIYLRNAYKYYLEEVRNDLEELNWDDLHFKYRVNFWEGVLRKQ